MPQFTEKTYGSSSRTIYINPHFNKQVKPMANGAANPVISKTITTGAHINPLFLGVYRPPAIHMNPNFFNNKLLEQQKLQLNYVSKDVNLSTNNSSNKSNQTKKLLLHGDIIDLCDESDQEVEKPVVNASLNMAPISKDIKQKIITKSRTKIVREPAVIKKVVMPAPSPLIRLSSKKLVRRTHITPTANLLHNITPASPKSTQGKYKLDRRLGLPAIKTSGVKVKRKSFVARYALQRSTSETKNALTSSKLRSPSINKKLQMININGVLYRSTRNKLQRKDASTSSNQLVPTSVASIGVKSNSNKNTIQKPSKTAYDRVLFVHGTKFVLDKHGFKLTRIAPTSKDSVTDTTKCTIPAQRQRQRIDIGGLTYIASTTQNVFVRTRNHLALAHLNTAKNRSLQLLTRRFVKTNIPCAIYQRIGKCIAHERGKCNKVHDKKQVTICPRFLRSECHNTDCLLSHNVSLAKMPVCKFFLQGVCVRTDCPYLHKKLSVNADICQDFLRGYCKLAEQCNKRHEFVCPEYERKGNCELVNCVYCKNRKRKLLNEPTKQPKKAVNNIQATQASTGVAQRYFIDKSPNANATTCDMTLKDESVEDEAIDTHTEASDSDDEMPSAFVRPKVGALPAFIPLL
ncbi:zinc finger CCCH domain-containing protein 3 [Zeugodacus cucurbitae]|uniref:zinc finger CCCH domain-containing protein 3 n=1 Tax=Zeugodacus cucurbitae TaxID=28588 RepID=UPI0005967BEE|nr:zinc finger CCCH domain-containing protein 3 [Zeugodacus cucurbitae]